MGIKILGAGKYLPPHIATNDDFAKIVDTNDEWITKRTGIKERHMANGELAYQMGAAAAKDAIKMSGISLDEIDMIIATTITGDTHTPSLSSLVGMELGIEQAACFDVNAACSGFVYALDMAEKYLNSGDCRNILIVSSEALTKLVDYTDRSSCILFGDGAGAVVVTKSNNMFKSKLRGVPTGAFKLIAKAPFPTNAFKTKECTWNNEDIEKLPTGYMYMDGHEIYKFATSAMANVVKEVLGNANLNIDDIDLLIPHQANIRIIQTAVKNLGINPEKCYICIEKTGNISSACIPVAIAQIMEEGKFKSGDKICLTGFGAGLTYAAAVFEW